MKILVVDREDLTAQLIKSKLEPVGHEVFHEPDKNNISDQLSKEKFDIIFLDPSPLSSPRPLILNIRRNVGYYPYVFLLHQDSSREEAIRSGTNDVMKKPLDTAGFDEKIDNAIRMTKLIKRMGDDSEDFPSASGIIAKSAFNQLFLSAIDRADRYGEQTFALFITITNYGDINYQDGESAASYVAAKLSQHLVRARRQSDIIGQTEKFEYALLLQRPAYNTEPTEAADRFAQTLHEAKDIVSEGTTPVEMTLNLISIPTGESIKQHKIAPENED